MKDGKVKIDVLNWSHLVELVLYLGCDYKKIKQYWRITLLNSTEGAGGGKKVISCVYFIPTSVHICVIFLDVYHDYTILGQYMQWLTV